MMRALVLLLFFGPSISFGEVLSEGWHKIMLAGDHVGYLVQRYEFDSKKKQFISTHFLRTNEKGGDISEGLKARSDKNLKPIEYQYTTKARGKATLIDGVFKNSQIVTTVHEGKKVSKFSSPVKKETFLSTFLVYVMLQNPNGIKVGNNYVYSAVAEETGKPADGRAFIKEMVDYKGKAAYRVLNQFNGIDFVSIMTDKGETLMTRTPALSITSEAVQQRLEATQGLPYDAKSLSTLFGIVPKSTSAFTK